MIAIADSAIRSHGPIVVFLWGLVKAILPFPTPSVLMLAGAARAEPGIRQAFWPIVVYVTLPAALGITLGGFVYYELARRRGREFVERFAGPGAAGLERLVGGHRGLLVCALRAVPLVPVMLGSLVGGLARQPAWEFAAWSFAGAAVRCFILAYAGFSARQGVGVLLRFVPHVPH